MRLIFSDKEGTHLLAVGLPDAEVMAEISQSDPKSGAVFFGSGDTTNEKPWKVSRKQLQLAGKKLEKIIGRFDEPRVKGITLHMEDGMSYGPSKGTTGFSLNGIPAMATESFSGKFVIILVAGDAQEERQLNGISQYRVDQGFLSVEYTTAQAAFAEMVNHIDTITQDIKSDSVWLHIEY